VKVRRRWLRFRERFGVGWAVGEGGARRRGFRRFRGRRLGRDCGWRVSLAQDEGEDSIPPHLGKQADFEPGTAEILGGRAWERILVRETLGPNI
jgi:hypothetical protein